MSGIKTTASASESIEKMISEFDGSNNLSINKWFEDYEEAAVAYNFSQIQVFVRARNKMVGLAMLFLDSQRVLTYASLKEKMQGLIAFRRYI